MRGNGIIDGQLSGSLVLGQRPGLVAQGLERCRPQGLDLEACALFAAERPQKRFGLEGRALIKQYLGEEFCSWTTATLTLEQLAARPLRLIKLTRLNQGLDPIEVLCGSRREGPGHSRSRRVIMGRSSAKGFDQVNMGT